MVSIDIQYMGLVTLTIYTEAMWALSSRGAGCCMEDLQLVRECKTRINGNRTSRISLEVCSWTKFGY